MPCSHSHTHSWRPIKDAPHNRYVMLRGPSGYNSTPHRVLVARWSEQSDNWRTHDGDSVTDSGPMPTEYMELIP